MHRPVGERVGGCHNPVPGCGTDVKKGSRSKTRETVLIDTLARAPMSSIVVFFDLAATTLPHPRGQSLETRHHVDQGCIPVDRHLVGGVAAHVVQVGPGRLDGRKPSEAVRGVLTTVVGAAGNPAGDRIVDVIGG